MSDKSIIDNMTTNQLKAKMLAAADVKLRSVLSDVDPFWIKWGFWLEKLDEKERQNNITFNDYNKEELHLEKYSSLYEDFRRCWDEARK